MFGVHEDVSVDGSCPVRQLIEGVLAPDVNPVKTFNDMLFGPNTSPGSLPKVRGNTSLEGTSECSEKENHHIPDTRHIKDLP